MASVTFSGNVDNLGMYETPSGIAYAAGSGLGFYGDDYGLSVPVGQYQNSTWVTNANGTALNAYKLNNTKYINETGVSHNNGTNRHVRMIPNYWAPLRIRFSHDTPVKVQNCKLRIFDRNDIENNASGVTTEVYEVRHPNPSPLVSGLSFRGIATQEWTPFFGDPGTPDDLDLTPGPGMSGLNTITGETVPSFEYYTSYVHTDGSSHKSPIHDWYIALSASPNGIGSKTQYGLYFTCEYLD